VVKPNFTTYGLLEKLLEKSPKATPEKNPSDAHAHKHNKLHPGKLFNNTNAAG